jgi:hypothetical protein
MDQANPVVLIEQALAALDQCCAGQAIALLRAALAASQTIGNPLLEQEVRYYLGALAVNRFSAVPAGGPGVF